MITGPVSRRRFLKGLGAAIALPYFPSIVPRSFWGGEDQVKPPARLLFLSVPLGFVPNQSLFTCPDFERAGAKGWFPDIDGPLTTMPEVHSSLQPYREHVSFLKGLGNHRYRDDIHAADNTFLTCADTFADPSKAFSNTVSCDQVAAWSAALGGVDVRHRSLALGISSGSFTRTGGLSWVDNGVPVSPLTSPAKVFDLLFGADDVPAATRLLNLKRKRSVLDVTLLQIKDLERILDAADRAKLDEAVTAVRDVEASIQREERWLASDKPTTAIARPDEAIPSNSVIHARTMLDLIHAAFVTDSTRVVTYQMPPSFSEVTPHDKHSLNHDLTPERAQDAVKVDRAMSEQLAPFIEKLCDSRESDGMPLIQHTLGAYGSGLWGANHSLVSLPIMLFGHGGGRITQGMTRRYDDTTPLANLWLTMLTAAGVVAPGGAFADSTGTLAGLM